MSSVLVRILWKKYYYPPFIVEKIETQKNKVLLLIGGRARIRT